MKFLKNVKNGRVLPRTAALAMKDGMVECDAKGNITGTVGKGNMRDVFMQLDAAIKDKEGLSAQITELTVELETYKKVFGVLEADTLSEAKARASADVDAEIYGEPAEPEAPVEPVEPVDPEAPVEPNLETASKKDVIAYLESRGVDVTPEHKSSKLRAVKDLLVAQALEVQKG